MGVILKIGLGLGYGALWFVSFVLIAVVFHAYGLKGVGYWILMGCFIQGLISWFELKNIQNKTWIVWLGIGVGMFRLLDAYPTFQQPEVVYWIKHVPSRWLGVVGWVVLVMFMGIPWILGMFIHKLKIAIKNKP